MMMIDIAMVVSNMLYLWGDDREEDEIYSIWLDRINANHDFADLDFIETLLLGRIHDGSFSPFREINLGFHGRTMQTWSVGLLVMIKVVKRQHGGTSPGLVWDPKIAWFEISSAIRYVSASLYFPEVLEWFLRGVVFRGVS
jgi:hypothetical protein